jgi:hypothetical protein
MRSVKPGEHRQKFIQGEQEAQEAAQRIFDHVGRRGFKSKRTKRLIEVYRYMGGLREHPKYLLTLILDECKKAIMTEAEELVKKGVLQQTEDGFFLTLDGMECRSPWLRQVLSSMRFYAQISPYAGILATWAWPLPRPDSHRLDDACFWARRTTKKPPFNLAVCYSRKGVP